MTERNFYKVKTGRYKTRGGNTAYVYVSDGSKFYGSFLGQFCFWSSTGTYFVGKSSDRDLMNYLGPIDRTEDESVEVEETPTKLSAEDLIQGLKDLGFDVSGVKEPVDWRLQLARELLANHLPNTDDKKEVLDGKRDKSWSVTMRSEAIKAALSHPMNKGAEYDSKPSDWMLAK